MLLDFLPFSRSPGRLRGRSGLLRYVHFLGGIGLVLVLWCVLRYRYGGPATALAWLIGGNALYYLAGVALAYRLRDNRAFCKYLCPVSVPLKVGSRLSLIKVKGDATKCTNCGACTRACPMDVRVPDYVRSGRRVLASECTLCQTCITVCPNNALRLSVGLDAGGADLLRQRPVAACPGGCPTAQAAVQSKL